MSDERLKAELFWEIADALIASGSAERGTLMGSPCLRAGGAFFAMVDHRSGDLIVKVSAARVAELIDAGAGEPFAPAGRVFREWVAVPTPDEPAWKRYMAEAREFVAGSG